MIEIIVPLKAALQAKGRLSATLPQRERQALVKAMATDVLSVVRELSDLCRGRVLMGSGWDPLLFAGPNIRCATEFAPCRGDLNAQLERALIDAHDCHRLVLFADLPLLTVAHLRALLEPLAEGRAVLCPDREGRGTNVLGIPAQRQISPRFGVDSFARHVDALSGTGLRVMPMIATGLDIDTPDDLLALQSLAHTQAEVHIGPATRAWLSQQWPPVTSKAPGFSARPAAGTGSAAMGMAQ
jgi:2-phospho-L-lactate guanylyltransferase